MSAATTAEEARITVTLDADEANAVVYTIALELTTEAEVLGDMPITTTPGDLFRIERRVGRIARLAAVNQQLSWRAHWGPLGGEPPAIEATEAVLLDLAAALERRGREQRKYPDPDADGPFAFDEAARRMARAFAECPADAARAR